MTDEYESLTREKEIMGRLERLRLAEIGLEFGRQELQKELDKGEGMIIVIINSECKFDMLEQDERLRELLQPKTIKEFKYKLRAGDYLN